MGKYMKKGKMTADVAVMEIPRSSSSTLGVRTRARTLALQPNPELSYLQLRSRRLEKPPVQVHPSPTKNSRARGKAGQGRPEEAEDASCGENNFDFDSRGRSTRESTPCSLIRGADSITTPGSTTRPTSASRRARNPQRAVPTTLEMEEFFAGFELHQQKQFIDKYNYDIMNDLPLPGRYEWVRVDN